MMYNPLLQDPSKIKDADLESKIIDLRKKYHIAAKMGHGMICDQIILTINLYREEQTRRHLETMQKIIKNQDKDLDDLINVD